MSTGTRVHGLWGPFGVWGLLSSLATATVAMLYVSRCTLLMVAVWHEPGIQVAAFGSLPHEVAGWIGGYVADWVC